ncbi:hypothetical protein FISHEDRAFT_54915 [Fistulina hepatica ATCC 64428]|uniref:Uncharacterized protein n=1 Tax=Fistulina hepatica ATCC 64428 TaxID=1128425 RepID=A0A0D7AR76_9AGAR|nr:hypothetical protein FISHEDRAFT_54915 [Fistulina hepatica ATCC 64428]
MPGAAKVTALLEVIDFQPDNFEGLPKYRDQNPHLQKTKCGDEPEMTVITSAVYLQETMFDRPYILLSILLANMEPALAKEIRTMPAKFLAAVNFGAGPVLEHTHNNLHKELVDFLSKAGLELGLSKDEINVMADSIIEPTRAEQVNYCPRFDRPWPRILEVPNKCLRDFLIWQGVFDISPTFAVMFIDPTDTPEQWFLTDIRHAALRNTPASYQAILAMIKVKLWDSMDFQNVIRDATVGQSTSIFMWMKEVLDSFDLVFMTFQEPGKDQRTPIFKLMCKPFIQGPNEVLQLRALSVICNAGVLDQGDVQRGNAGAKAGYGQSRAARERYMVGHHAVTMQRAFPLCDWCKSVMYPTADCTYPASAGWRGPRQEDLPMVKGGDNDGQLLSHSAEHAQRGRAFRRGGHMCRRGRGGHWIGGSH